MSRLDQHIDAVRTRFLLQKLLHYAAWTLLGTAGGLVAVTLICRLFAVGLPPRLLLWSLFGIVAVLVALALAVRRCPTRHATATRMDEVLGLKERFSTALLARDSDDPFAHAAVHDAEQVAGQVSIHKRFPYQFPRMGAWALGGVALLLVVDQYMPVVDVLSREEKARIAAVQAQKQKEAHDLVEKALAEVNSIPKVGGEEKALATAKSELQNLLSEPIKDPAEASRTAQKAMQDAEALRDRVKDTQRLADAAEQAKAFKSLANTPMGNTLSDTKKAMSEGQFDKAAAKLQDAIKEFNSADAQKQAEMAKDMTQLANQLKQLANDPAVQEQIRKQLQQAGANKEQAERMMDEMQKAAAGDKEAANRVKDMAENLARQHNGGILPAPEALQKFMTQVQQAQGKMNAQQMAQQLSQAGQQMANAMQQQARQNASNQSGQANQNPAGQKNGQSGKQPGNQQNQSEMADAQQAMQDSMNQLEAMQQEAQMAGACSGDAEGQGGQGQGKWGNGQGMGNNPGQQGGGNGWAGQNGGGQAMGDRSYKSPAPYSIKKEVSRGERDDRGKVQAGWFVKADSIKGESKAQLQELIMSGQKDATDEVEQEHVPNEAQQVVRKYFDSMQNDVK